MSIRRVGHKGADHIAPGNTFASFQAALDVGVDMIEFDVISEHPGGGGELLLAHDLEDAAQRVAHTLDEGLAHFAAAGYENVDLIVDLKLRGYECRVAEAIERHGLAARALVSTMEEPSLALLRECHPQIALGWSAAQPGHGAARPRRAAVHTPRVAGGHDEPHPARGDRRADGALAPGDAAPGALDPGGGRCALRLDGRRSPADRRPGADGGHGRDLQRPAVVRRL
jgi:hypothetical protein